MRRLTSFARALIGSATLMLTAAPPAAARPQTLFKTSDQCMACHNGLIAPSGQDVSIGFNWRPSMMANASRDPYWQAAVRREVMDHPDASAAIQNECSACHMPMARYEAKVAGGKGQVFAHLPLSQLAPTPAGVLAADGVSCAMCHQITGDTLGTKESFTAGFVVDEKTPWGQRPAYGPYAVDRGRSRVMRSAVELEPSEASHIQKSELCATCHTLYTHARGPRGEDLGTLPEQVPYLEWKHSAFAQVQSCQDCHMPVLADKAPIASVLPQPREHFSQHVFRGGNFFMPKVFNKHAAALGVTATPQELDAIVRRTVEHLTQKSAELTVENPVLADGTFSAEVVVTNLAGHKLPTAYPSRRAWLHVRIVDADGAVVLESGAVAADGSIAGNDNDADPRKLEPHYTTIDSGDQVQIYEAIMADHAGQVTTGLISGVRFIKDNRVPPDGFDKGKVPDDVAVKGAAADDPDFDGGGDRVRYRAKVGDARGPFTVEAALYYQPISYRWAHNLGDYAAPEPRRFMGYYKELSEVSWQRLAHTTKSWSPAPQGGAAVAEDTPDADPAAVTTSTRP